MAKPQAFGRRAPPARSVAESARPRATTAIIPELSALAPAKSEVPEIDEELRQWQQTRKRNVRIPWRQLSLMAGLCFGVASLILPDEVNDTLQWPLYALMAASFFAGLRRRRDATETPPAQQPESP